MATNDRIEHIIAVLKGRKEFLAQNYKIKEIGIFGSYVRGEQDSKSDIDILIDKDEAIGLLKLANLQNYLSRLIGVHVDLVIKKKLLPHLRKNILAEVIYV